MFIPNTPQDVINLVRRATTPTKPIAQMTQEEKRDGYLLAVTSGEVLDAVKKGMLAGLTVQEAYAEVHDRLASGSEVSAESIKKLEAFA